MFNFCPDLNSSVPVEQQYTNYENSKFFGDILIIILTIFIFIIVVYLILNTLYSIINDETIPEYIKRKIHNYLWRKRYWKEQRELWRNSQ